MKIYRAHTTELIMSGCVFVPFTAYVQAGGDI